MRYHITFQSNIQQGIIFIWQCVARVTMARITAKKPQNTVQIWLPNVFRVFILHVKMKSTYDTFLVSALSGIMTLTSDFLA